MHALTKPFSAVPVVAIGLVLMGLAVARIHVRVQTTLVGYEIGHLKTQEAQLLEQRSSLKMQLAKLTSKKHLQLMSSSGTGGKTSLGTVALK